MEGILAGGDEEKPFQGRTSVPLLLSSNWKSIRPAEILHQQSCKVLLRVIFHPNPQRSWEK